MKEKNLEKMKNNGINVPSFIVITRKEIENDCFTDRINQLPKGMYAIRSSCNIEDGIDNSFAGQFDTYLNIANDDIYKYILKCYNSMNNANVKDYIEKQNINVNNLEMNVIVQEMVNSDYSGVLFTANPQGIINEIVIVVGKGLGENVVTDKIETTTYYYNTTDDIYYFDGKEEYLSTDQINTLVEISKKIEELFGKYMDIEFAIENNAIKIVQARKITTINDENLLILDNSNIVESYPGICLPLTDSFVNIIYSGTFMGLAKRVVKNDKIIARYSDVFLNMVGSCNGRMYYKISNWYTMLKFLPFNKKYIPVWQDMLGVKIKKYDEKKNILPMFMRIATYFNTAYEFLTVTKHMEELNIEFDEINKYFYQKFNERISIEELVILYNEIRNRLLKIWDITLINDLYAFVFTGLLKKKVKNEQQINEYISGITNIESMKPIRKLINITYKYQDEDVKNKSNEFEKEFNEYINLYGDRIAEELKLETKTFRTNPELLDEKIKAYREDKRKLYEIYKNINETDTSNKKLKFLSRHVMIGIKNREKSRINRTRIFGMVRNIFIMFGKRFVEAKYINNIEDIFYLKIEEVFNYKNLSSTYLELIKNRKNEYEQYKLLPAYTRLIFSNGIVNKRSLNINTQTPIVDSNELIGIPCSNGKITGEVVVVDDVNNIKTDLKNKILVTKMTDPGWVFLLANSKGVISEKGSILSHTAIISRELKIPSIVGISNATNILKTGDIITMDGGTGKIIMEEKSGVR